MTTVAEKCFIVPADTFDNVKGQFPIGFFVWRLRNDGASPSQSEVNDGASPSQSEVNDGEGAVATHPFTSAIVDVYDREGAFIGKKSICSPDGQRVLMDWIRQFYDKAGVSHFHNSTLSYFHNFTISHFSTSARAVLDAGRELWRYYHAQPGASPNASFYDIRLHFQGVKRTASGKVQMNNTSADERYNNLLAALRTAHRALAAQIAQKVYEYGFLRK